MTDKPIVIKDLKPGAFVMVEGEPCKVVDVVISKPGKHGSTKARVETMGLFDNRRRYILKPAADTVDSPLIEKKRAQVVSVAGETAQLMDLEDFSTFDVPIPEELKAKIQPGAEIGYWKVAGRIMLKE